MRTRTPLLLVAALVAAVCPVLPATAVAKKPALGKVAKFKATLVGSQHVQWDYVRHQTSMCSGSETGSGVTRITFRGTGTVTAFQPARSSPVYKLTKGGVLATNTLKPKVTATRTGTHSVTPAPVPPCPDDGDGTGAGPAPTQCGTRTSQYSVTLRSLYKNTLRFSAVARRGWRGGVNPGSPLGDTFANCPSWITGPYAPAEANGEFEFIDVKLSQAKLLNPKKPVIKMYGLDNQCYISTGPIGRCGKNGIEDPFQGEVKSSWDLKLKRIR
jgi:hypothetical protein